MQVELTEEQVVGLYNMVASAQIKGADAEVIVELKNALKRALPKEEEKK